MEVRPVRVKSVRISLMAWREPPVEYRPEGEVRCELWVSQNWKAGEERWAERVVRRRGRKRGCVPRPNWRGVSGWLVGLGGFWSAAEGQRGLRLSLKLHVEKEAAVSCAKDGNVINNACLRGGGLRGTRRLPEGGQ